MITNTLSRVWQKGKFNNFIQRIRFPFFKNIEDDTSLSFDFPITAFIGQNGCGKSTALQAIAGCPARQSPRKYWFSTQMDPIKEFGDSEKRHSIAYSYGRSGQISLLEVLKIRIEKIGRDPDYWETSKPYAKYGCKLKQRIDPVNKPVLYLDFRGELSAFDKYFYFNSPHPKKHKSKTKQDFLRNKSKQLKSAVLSKKVHHSAHSISQNELPYDLLKTEVDTISDILGKNYEAITLIKHKFYEDWGWSAVLQEGNKNYSEAFAGSGEMAVIRLAYEVLNAPKNTLILLDEPEVSLHPGAQKRLLDFLKVECLKKKHQVVLSTHSPAVIEELPPQAIKLFWKNQRGKFDVIENVLPQQAFSFIGSTITDKIEIIVEDNLAQKIVESVSRDLPEGQSNLLQIATRPCGADALLTKHAVVFSQEIVQNKYLILDGDQRTAAIDLSTIRHDQYNSVEIGTHIKNTINQDVNVYPQGGIGEPRETCEVELLEKFSVYYNNNVSFLPKNIPEEIIWSDELCKHELSALFETPKVEEVISRINHTPCSKEKFVLLVKELYDEDLTHYSAVTDKFLIKWKKSKDAAFIDIRSTLEAILAQDNDL